MRHGACKAQGDGRTKQEAPGFGVGIFEAKLKAQFPTLNCFFFLLYFFFTLRPTKFPPCTWSSWDQEGTCSQGYA